MTSCISKNEKEAPRATLMRSLRLLPLHHGTGVQPKAYRHRTSAASTKLELTGALGFRGFLESFRLLQLLGAPDTSAAPIVLNVLVHQVRPGCRFLWVCIGGV